MFKFQLKIYIRYIIYAKFNSVENTFFSNRKNNFGIEIFTSCGILITYSIFSYANLQRITQK